MTEKTTDKAKKGEGAMVVKELPIAAAVVQPDKNARKDGKGGTDYAPVPGLMKDIQGAGLLQPVVGHENPDGSWTIDAGFCRYEACKRLGWAKIPVSVIKPPTEKERAILNGRENMSRDNLTTYDKARYLCDLQESHKMSVRDILAALPGDISLNSKAIQLYTNAVKQLHPKVLDAWMANHKMASTMRIFALLKHPQEKHPEIWDAMVNAEAAILREAGVIELDVKAILDNPYDAEAFDRALRGKQTRGKKGAQTQVSDVTGENKGNGKVKKPDTDTIALVLGWLREGLDDVSPEACKVATHAIAWMTGSEKCLVIEGTTVFDPEAHASEKAKQSEVEKMKAAINKRDAENAAMKAKLAELGVTL